MRISFYGATREVGRSLFKIDDRIALDCGIKLGKEIEYPAIDEKEIPSKILISHSHLDHIGNLVHLKKQRTIISTKPTRDLIPVLISDYSRIAGIDFQANSLMKNISIVEYEEKFNVHGYEIEFFNAGHILGSAMIKINDVLYTGDFNMRSSKILNPAFPVKAKTLIMESTYGGKEDIIPSLKQEFSKLANIINETIDRGGAVLIPSFAVGRAQEILIGLDSLMRSGVIRKVPIYIDGMIKKAMKIYRMNVIYAKKDIQNQILMSLHDPFRSKNFFVSKSIKRRDVKKPCIIVTTSGMLTGGPVFNYLEMFGEDENSSLVFVGYQAEGTLGRAILEGERNLLINEKEITLRMRVERVKISGHSDRNDLIRFVNSVKPEKVILVHGEEKKQKELREALENKYEVIIPSLGEELNI